MQTDTPYEAYRYVRHGIYHFVSLVDSFQMLLYFVRKYKGFIRYQKYNLSKLINCRRKNSDNVALHVRILAFKKKWKPGVQKHARKH